MSSENSSSDVVVNREDKPVLSFVLLVVVIIGVYYATRKFVGNIPALIIAYLLYVYRNELSKELGDLTHGRP